MDLNDQSTLKLLEFLWWILQQAYTDTSAHRDHKCIPWRQNNKDNTNQWAKQKQIQHTELKLAILPLAKA